MAGPGHFEPIFPAHAIERCTASVFFHEVIPGKLLQRMRDDAAPIASAMGLAQTFEPATFGFPINLVANQMIRIDGAGAGNARFTSDDESLSLAISSNVLIWQTLSYVRWDPFIGQFDELVAPLIARIAEIVPISVVKLEYVDRFFWSSDDWESIDYAQLLDPSSDIIAHRGPKAGREWHSHVGWFQPMSDRRRLINVNVDVVALPRGDDHEPRPSVGILTMAQDQQAAPAAMLPPTWAEEQRATEVLDEQHRLLKAMLGGVITAEAAGKIGLRITP